MAVLEKVRVLELTSGAEMENVDVDADVEDGRPALFAGNVPVASALTAEPVMVERRAKELLACNMPVGVAAAW